MLFLVKLMVTVSLMMSADPDHPAASLAPGSQPQLALAPGGIARLAFGRSDSIFCASSADGGRHFSQPELVGVVAGMHLGMTRGPQIACSNHYTVITAMDKKGNIHLFRLSSNRHRWESLGLLNDLPQTAPEGLMAIAANEQDQFFAVWLDTRKDGHNNIYFAAASGGAHWTPSRLVYASPDGHVCECCKPSIAVQGNTVAIMFRNWLGGARDLYYTRSGDGGKTFTPAEKLGQGSWPLDGCPMDGGGIAVDRQGTIHTAWRRGNQLYYCQPGQPEEVLGPGRLCGIALSDKGKAVISLQQDGEIWLQDPAGGNRTTLGAGAFLKTLAIPGKGLLCTWEINKEVKYQYLPN
jgi:hypothetical protein